MEDPAMPDETLRPDITLPELLARRARGASDGRLVADAAGGVLVAAAALFWRPQLWPLVVSAAMCFSAFGLWGIADRALGGSRATVPLALRGAATALGVLAALALLASVLAMGLGTIIS
jgi:hypothetical protein